MPYVTIAGQRKYLSQNDFDRIKRHVSRDDSGDFILSAAIGALTGSSILGGLLGGSFTGGFLGDFLEGSDDSIF